MRGSQDGGPRSGRAVGMTSLVGSVASATRNKPCVHAPSGRAVLRHWRRLPLGLAQTDGTDKPAVLLATDRQLCATLAQPGVTQHRSDRSSDQRLGLEDASRRQHGSRCRLQRGIAAVSTVVKAMSIHPSSARPLLWQRQLGLWGARAGAYRCVCVATPRCLSRRAPS
jgi:hypothetical protein